MSLDPGTRLGPHEILAPIGAGGMGEVYKAKDTRLDRIVAIKVLPEHLAESPERKQRFEREAKAISQLNHPHICTLYDVGEQDGIDYLVMEYIEGETLADRLKRGPLPFDEALRYAHQLADGLGKAHRQGVVHRDIKPGNVVLTQSGPKLLDFGLAKLRGTGLVSGGAEASALPTQDKPLTDAHTILGTLQYMAPEQLEGKDTDARSDIFAFGALLYEMVTGKKAFEGASQASLIAAILEKEPAPISLLQPMSPRALDRVLRTCLAQKPDNRWQSVEDVGRQLEWIAQGEQESAAPLKNNRIPILVAAAAALVAAVVAWTLKPTPTSLSSPARFSLELPSSAIGATHAGGVAFSSSLAISPDGSTLVYTGSEGPVLQLYQRRLDQFDSNAIPGTEGAGAPFFSPDGEWIGFFTLDRIKKARLDGGAPATICNCRGLGASWGKDGHIYFTASNQSGISRVSEDGGEPESLTQTNPEAQFTHYSPHVLPDGTVLFSIWNLNSTGELHLLSPESKETRPLGLDIPVALTATYLPTGHLLFETMSGLAAVRFDLARLETTGTPVTVVDEVFTDTALGIAHYAVSENGTLFYIPGLVDSRILRVDRGGRATQLLDAQHPYFIPRLSPDGTRVALVIYDDSISQRHIWSYELDRGALTRLTFGEGHSTDPVWSPDGTRFAFVSNRSGIWKPYWKSSDGSGAVTEVAHGDRTVMTASWSPDGEWLFFKEGGEAGNWDIGAVRVDGTEESRVLLGTSYEELFPSLSPDGRFLAYTSDETGRREVYVRAFPDLTGKRQISTNGGSEPVWAKNGGELFYRETRQLMSVPVRTQPEFSAGRPELLFEGQYEIEPFGGDASNYDVSNDGQSFIMIGDAEQSQRLNIVLNWFDELERLVPTP